MEQDARVLIDLHHEAFEFCNIYEDDDIADDYTEEEQRQLLTLVHTAGLTVEWEGVK
jgi:hypothetical protein